MLLKQSVKCIHFMTAEKQNIQGHLQALKSSIYQKQLTAQQEG